MPYKRASISIGVLLGNVEAVHFQGFERYEMYIWVPHLDPEVIKILRLSEVNASLKHIWVPSFWARRILGN
jgi:hypothetical protein